MIRVYLYREHDSHLATRVEQLLVRVVRVKLALVDHGQAHVGLDQLVQVSPHVVAHADRLALAVGVELLECAPRAESEFARLLERWLRFLRVHERNAREMDQVEVHVVDLQLATALLERLERLLVAHVLEEELGHHEQLASVNVACLFWLVYLLCLAFIFIIKIRCFDDSTLIALPTSCSLL